MPPRVSYFTGIWDPAREGISKEVEGLRRELQPKSPVVSFSAGQRSSLRLGLRVARLSGKRWLSLRALAPIVERCGDVTHVIGRADDWHLLKSVGRRPVIFTVVASGNPSSPDPYRHVAVFVVEAEPLAADLRRHGVADHRIRVVYPGVDLEQFRPMPAPPPQPYRILFASTPADPSEFDARGIPLLIELARLRPDIEVVLLWRQWGDVAAARRVLHAMTPPANLRVEFHDVADMAEVYGQAHACAAPYAHGFGKSCPNSIVEALACGRPAIVTEGVGIAGLIEQHGAGVVAARSALSLSQAIDRLRNDYDGHARRARQLAEAQFDRQSMFHAYRRMYQQLSDNSILSTESRRTIPIMVKVWAGAGSHRYRYIRRSIPSLLASNLPDGVRIVLVDDQSTDMRVVRLLSQWAAADSRVEVWRNPERMGPNRGQEYNVPRLAQRFPDASEFVFCDDDVIYQPGWLQRLLRVREEANEAGIHGVFSALNVPFRPSYRAVRLSTSEVLLKERQAALNWLVPRDVYEQVGPFRDAGIAYDTEYCDRLARHAVPVICLRPSYVQNIGYFGAYQSGDIYTAPDYVGARDMWLRARDASLACARILKRAAAALRLEPT